MENYLYTSVPISSVPTEQSQICVVNPGHVEQEQGDLLSQSNLIHISRQQIFLVTTPTLSLEIPAEENLLQKHTERVERLSQHDRLIKICIDAGFLTTVEVGQYFMTKDTEGEHTLPRDDQSSDPKRWIGGNTKIGPVLEVTTSYLQGEYGVEIRIESVNKDNSHSWVRISDGLNNLVTDLINKENDDNEQETSETKSE